MEWLGDLVEGTIVMFVPVVSWVAESDTVESQGETTATIVAEKAKRDTVVIVVAEEAYGGMTMVAQGGLKKW